jgi:hypothetical protein
MNVQSGECAAQTDLVGLSFSNTDLHAMAVATDLILRPEYRLYCPILGRINEIEV